MATLINNHTHHTITEDGVITNTKTGNVKAHWVAANGYYYVDIQENGKSTKYPVHRLLALQYLPNPENKRTVNHIDGNKLNNTLSNLEWATDSENVKHAYDNGLQADQRKHDNTFYENLLLCYFMNGMSITSISELVMVNNTITQLSIHLRRAAKRLNLEDKFDEELKRQKTKRAAKAQHKTYKVNMIDIDSKTILNTFDSLKEATTYLGKKSSGPISNVLAGRQKTAYGYFWKRV